jgi:two-component system NtrC family sensor kinase
MNNNIILNFKQIADSAIIIEKLRSQNIPIDEALIVLKKDLKKENIINVGEYIFNCTKASIDLWFINIQKQVIVDDKLLTLGEMASSIFHELNTPLGISIASLELFKMDLEDVPNEEQRNTLTSHIANLENGLTRMVQISEGIHNFCRNTQDQFVDVNLITLFDQVMSYYGHLLQKNHIKFSIKSDPKANYNVTCKHALISQVFVNLLKNSRDALETQSQFNKWIRVEFIESEDSVKIKFFDGGSGIPLDVQSKIFEHFFTTKAIGKGTGIGLSFCKKVVSQHNGSLTIDNSIKNTCFDIVLPKKIGKI